MSRCLKRWMPLDDPISFHIAVATLIALNSAVHARLLSGPCRARAQDPEARHRSSPLSGGWVARDPHRSHRRVACVAVWSLDS